MRTVTVVLVLAAVVATAAGPPLPTWQARVVSVLDGDTLTADVLLWPGLTQRISVRILGVDAPEIHQPKCAAERKNAGRAQTALAGLTPVGTLVALRDIQPDKYGGRVDAEVWTASGAPVAETLLGKGLVQRWSGQGPKPSWCGQPR